MENLLNPLLSLLPAGIDWPMIGKFILLLILSYLVIGFIGKLLFGKGADTRQAMGGSIGVLFLYAVACVIYTFRPGDLARYLAPLPFVGFSGDKLYLFSFTDSGFPSICHQLLSMIILVYLYNHMDDFMPRGKKLYWLLYRLLTIAMALTLHYVVHWAFNRYLPGVLVTYAPTVLLLILLSFLLLGILKVILGVVLTVVNPFLGAVYAFFFASKSGRQISRAVLSTLMLAVLVMLLHYFGFGVISVSEASLIAYIPLALLLLLLWYLVGYKLS